MGKSSKSSAPIQLRTGKRKCKDAYEIKEILGHRTRWGKKEYKVSWLGYDTTDWITTLNFCTPGAYDLLTSYRIKVMGMPCRPKKYPKYIIQDDSSALVVADNNDTLTDDESVSAKVEEMEVQLETSYAKDKVVEYSNKTVDSEGKTDANETSFQLTANADKLDSDFGDFDSEPDDPVPDLSHYDVMLTPEETAHLPRFHAKFKLLDK